MKHKLFYLFLALTLIAFNVAPVYAQEGTPPDRRNGRNLPAGVVENRLGSPLQMEGINLGVLDSSLVGAQGYQKVIITLTAESGAKAFERGFDTGRARDKARSQQEEFIRFVTQVDPSARVIARVQIVMNAVFIEVDAAALPALSQDGRVQRITPVANYEVDLHETVPYIGASAVQSLGYDGSGVKVAVLDSGIDYLHAAMGGSGNPDEFAANDPSVIEPGSFPTAKVVNGYDFVGSVWDGDSDAPEMPDPDPLDDGPGGGHGTHVSHIIGGAGGVAPGVSLYAVKVCSSVSTACSGIALIQGLEYAADPNGDGKVKDRVDIINMSLGSPYGQPFDDDLSAAVNNATALGILTVASSGNSGDKPYVTGTPGAAATALSVAQTSVPSEVLPLMTIVAPESAVGQYPAVFQTFSVPLTSVIEAPLQYGDGAGGNLNGCAPFAPGSLAGLVVLVDRGACNFSLKISNISQGGALAGIIGLIAPGDPFNGSDGGDRPIDIPGYMVSQAVSNLLKSGLPGTVVRFDPAVGVPLVGTVVGSSSRGPQHDEFTLVKPEIGAPGASVSALAGTGTGTGPFGGTSGAAPMVTGSAALLIDKYGGSDRFVLGRGLAPIETKALLMNNAETYVLNDALTGMPAPISRIGGGEVRVDRAINAPVVAFDLLGLSGGLSFGQVDVADNKVTLKQVVRVRNLDRGQHVYTITPTFRFPEDQASGAVTISAPSKVTVRRGFFMEALFTVTITINGALLPENAMNSGSEGANPAALNYNEFDGYLVLNDGGHQINIPWHVLPRKAARVIPTTNKLMSNGAPQVIGLNNTGVGTAQNDSYALLATSPDIPEGAWGEGAPTPDIRAVGINTFPVPAGFCLDQESFVWAFAINTWERQEHLLPVSHQVYLDINRDGVDDYVILNRDASGLSTIADGRQLTWALDLATGSASAWFYTEHATNTGNTVLTVCAEQVGLTAADMLATNVDMDVVAQDFYFGGPGDLIEGLTVTPLGERFVGSAADVPGRTKDPAALQVTDYGLFPGNTPERGLLLFTNGDRGAARRGGATEKTEALIFLAK